MRRAWQVSAVVGLALAAASLPGAAGAAGPAVIYGCTPAPADCTGWYRTPVTLRWFPDAAAVNVTGCDTRTFTQDTGPAGSVQTCSVQLVIDGPTTSVTVPVHFDATPPQVTGAVPDRPPDAAGWYNRAVAVAFAGADGGAGVAGCTSVTYAGPDTAAGSITGTCTDRAGNTSTPLAFALRYDATPPSIEAAAADTGNGFARLRWRAAPDAVAIEVARAPATAGAAVTTIYRGAGAAFRDAGLRNGVRYRYTVTAFDAAGNGASRTLVAIPRAGLWGPRRGARVRRPPRLRWARVSRARYYNVQLFRGSRKVLSAWPAGTSLRLHRAWRHAGSRRRLAPGRYRWYVWPGLGRRSAHRYGRLLGRSSFVVVR